MLIFLGVLAAALLGGMIYTFLSTKSTKSIKLAALIALALSGISLAVCGIFVVLSGGAAPAEGLYPVPAAVEEAPVDSGNDILVIAIILVILLAFFGFIIFLGLKDQKKKTEFNNTGARAGGAKKAAGKNAGANTLAENTGGNSDIEFDSLDF
jgi:heme/copper-type cytochrome/quinol oxidase subunit 2